jgi:hypothetical protein
MVDAASSTAAGWRSRTRAMLVWAGLLALGAVLLVGRFDWREADGRYARIAYFTSLYFFLLAIPLCHGLVRAITGRARVAQLSAAALALAFCLPYHWLGLARWRLMVRVFDPPASTRMTWLPAAIGRSDFPGESLFFIALLVVFAAAVWAACGRGVAPQKWLRRSAPLLAAFAAIVIQTWLHTSLRSPYVYTQYFEAETWNHKCMLEGGMAAVNGDVGFFTTLSDMFNGVPHPVETMLLRRSFVHWLSSPFTYFWNPFHVFLILNPLIWLAAVGAAYGFARRVTGDERTAMLTAALVCMGNGFIYFAAQPMHYVAGFAIVIFALYLFEVLVVERQAWLVYGVALGLCAATYDLFPLYPALLILALYRRVSWRVTVPALLLSLCVYGGFLAVAYRGLHLPNNSYNTDHGTSAATNMLALFKTGGFGALYLAMVGLGRTLSQNLLFAFFVLETLAAGAMLLLAQRRQQVLLLILCIPVVLLNTYLYLGGIKWATTLLIELPRLSYIAYPAIYLALAIGLARLPRRWPALPLAAIFLWHNVDVFGLPNMHFHFYFPQRLLFLKG